LIEQCEKYPGKLDSQVLQTRCALVDLYQRLGDNEQVANALGKAQAALEKILTSTPKKTELLLETCTQVARLHIENDYRQDAEDIFERIGAEAEDTLGTDHQATIRILIRIGKTYQVKNMWTNAQPWFERALAASMTANGLEDTMTKSLEAAIENKHYAASELEAGSLAALSRLLVARRGPFSLHRGFF
jgi:tetratricopeptide (TPR) repeat protein